MSLLDWFNCTKINKVQKLQVSNCYDERISIYDFELLELVGQGAYSSVYVANWVPKKKKVCIKVITKDGPSDNKTILQLLQNEVIIMQNLNSKFIEKCYGAFQTDNYLVIILEYVVARDLYQFVKTFAKLDMQTVKLIVAQVIIAIEELHKNQIIMRDLKPENILVQQDGYIKLIDFGLSAQNIFSDNNVRSTLKCGTPLYFAPEQIQGNEYGTEVDIWGLGVLTYELITGTTPFCAEDVETVEDQIVNAHPAFDRNLFSKDATDFIQQCLTKTQMYRIGYKNFSQIYDHKFFQNIDFQKLRDKKYNLIYIKKYTRKLMKQQLRFKIKPDQLVSEQQLFKMGKKITNYTQFKLFQVDAYYLKKRKQDILVFDK